MAYGSRRYICPDCGQPTTRTDPHNQKIGLFIFHVGCRATCPFCEQVIEQPPVGQPQAVVAWCGKPAHGACKERQQKAGAVTERMRRRTETVNLPEHRGYADEPSMTRGSSRYGRQPQAERPPAEAVPPQDRVVYSKFSSTCPICLKGIKVGDAIQADGTKWPHATCVEAARKRR